MAPAKVLMSVVLPEELSPRDAVHLVGSYRNRDVVDRAHLAFHAEVPGLVVGLEVGNGEEVDRFGGTGPAGCGGCHQPPILRSRERGSMYSLSETASR